MTRVIAGRTVMMPLVAADKARLDSLRPIAESLQKNTGKPFRLMRFSVPEIIDVLGPPFSSLH